MTDAEGRRVYVHSRTFLALSRQSGGNAQDVARALVDTTIRRASLNHLGDVNVLLGLVPQELSDEVARTFSLEPLTDLLQSTGFRPADPRQFRAFLPILGEDEVISATCFDAGYFTIATSSLAASRMYGDDEPIRDLRQKIERRGAGVADLTLISGSSVARFANGPGSGTNSAQYYQRWFREVAVTDVELMSIFDERADRRMVDLRRLLMKYGPQGDVATVPTTALVNVRDNCLRVLNRMKRDLLPASNDEV